MLLSAVASVRPLRLELLAAVLADEGPLVGGFSWVLLNYLLPLRLELDSPSFELRLLAAEV
jgi:hypothetical protein